MSDHQERGGYTPDDDLKLHNENAIKLICKPFQSHETGYPEWLKNASDEYARTDAPETDRIIVLLLQNGRSGGPSTTVACLDFCGMSSTVIDDEFRHWADPDASRRDADDDAEIQGGHGNGGKCYMTQMFEDRAYIHTTKGQLGNVYGTIGGSIHLGYFPNRTDGKDFAVEEVRSELDRALKEIGLQTSDLPDVALTALDTRQGFTLAVGRGAKGYGSRIPAQHLIDNLVEHPQMRRTLEMCKVYVIVNGTPANTGHPLMLPQIPPLPGAEEPREIDIPHTLVDPSTGEEVSTTGEGTEPPGMLTLRTSDTRMWRGAKKSRHNVAYKARSGYIGYKPVADFDVSSTYRDRIYGDCVLLALEPAKLNDRAALASSPLVRAVENWIGEQIEAYAKEFEARDRRKHDQEEKDALAQINAALDNWKNKLLDSVLGEDEGEGDGDGEGPTPPPPPRPYGDVARIELSLPFYRAGRGIAMQPKLSAFDSSDKPVRPPAVTWTSSNESVATVDDTIRVVTTAAVGTTVLHCETFDKQISSNTVTLEVVDITSIKLEPEIIEMPAGSRRRITATCTLSSGEDATDIALAWIEDDPSVARVSATGTVFGFTQGTTDVAAVDDAVTADNEVALTVGPAEDNGGGKAYPRVLISEINADPDTGDTVVLSGDDPPVHQRPIDVERNIWWINSASPLARMYLDTEFGPESREWRIYHLERYIDVIVQIAMSQGSEADDEMNAGDWMARWGERAANIQAAAATGLASFIQDGDLPS
jgi:hypothetical protein